MLGTHEGAFSSSLNLPRVLASRYLVEILLPRMKYTDERVGTHGGALLQECAPGECSRSKTACVYWPLSIQETKGKLLEGKKEPTFRAKLS